MQKLTDAEVLKRVKSHRADEQKITAEIISLLQIIQERKIYASLGYSSLFMFVTKELGYSEAAAMRRISSMKLVRQFPELKDKISEGNLSLSNLAQTQQFFENEKKNNNIIPAEKKKEIIESVQDKSTRDAAKELAALSTVPVQLNQPDKTKPLNKDYSEIKFVASNDLVKQLDEIKDLLGHKGGDLSMRDVVAEMTKIALKVLKKNKFGLTNKEIEKEVKPFLEEENRLLHEAKEKGISVPPKGISSDDLSLFPALFPAKSLPASKPTNRYIPREIKRAVYLRDGGRCTYLNHQTRKRCDASFGLEYEHIQPYAMGGEHSTENLTLLCKAHNQLSGIRAFGEKKMNRMVSAAPCIPPSPPLACRTGTAIRVT